MKRENKKPSITLKDLNKMGCVRFGLISKKKRILGIALISLSFIIPDLGLGLISGLLVMGYSPILIIKNKYRSFKEWISLK